MLAPACKRDGDQRRESASPVSSETPPTLPTHGLPPRADVQAVHLGGRVRLYSQAGAYDADGLNEATDKAAAGENDDLGVPSLSSRPSTLCMALLSSNEANTNSG